MLTNTDEGRGGGVEVRKIFIKCSFKVKKMWIERTIGANLTMNIMQSQSKNIAGKEASQKRHGHNIDFCGLKRIARPSHKSIFGPLFVVQ